SFAVVRNRSPDRDCTLGQTPVAGADLLQPRSVRIEEQEIRSAAWLRSLVSSDDCAAIISTHGLASATGQPPGLTRQREFHLTLATDLKESDAAVIVLANQWPVKTPCKDDDNRFSNGRAKEGLALLAQLKEVVFALRGRIAADEPIWRTVFAGFHHVGRSNRPETAPADLLAVSLVKEPYLFDVRMKVFKSLENVS